MSTTIDQRVVEMQFDNKHFERNVATTMSSLDKLKQSLNLPDGSKSLENIGNAAKRIDMAGLGSAVETVQAKFSALGVMGVTALANITNSAVNAGKRMVSALTIDPIISGFKEYETQIGAVQTILANTQSKGTTLDDVNAALDELNSYADKTIYNFTEMTRNIGTFTAAGVDLDTSVKSIQGIANLAAVSGSTSQQASTAMYQLSQALAAGKVSLMDWNSVVNAGMGGQVFQDALKRTAETMGTDVDALIKKYGSFRESLTKGEWLTSDVLTKTLEQFTMAAEEGTEQWEAYKKSLMDDGYTAAQAEEILKMANTATDAATKVKTFTQLWDTLKEAAQSGWSQTWEIVVGDFEEAKETLTEFSEVIGKMIGDSANARNELLQGWKDAGGRLDLVDSIYNTFEAIMSIVTPIKEAFREIFPPITVEQLVKFTEGLKNLTASLKLSDKASDNLKRTFKGIFAAADIVRQVFVAVFDVLKPLFGGVDDLGGGILTLTANIGDAVVKFNEFIKTNNVFGKVARAIVVVIEAIYSKISDFVTNIKDGFKVPGLELFQALLDRVSERMDMIKSSADGMKSGVVLAIEAMGAALANCQFFKLMGALWDFVKAIGSGIADALGGLAGGLIDKLGNANFDGIFDFINSLSFAGIGVFFAKFVQGFSDITDSVGDFKESALDILDEVKDTFKAYQTQLKAGALLKIASAIAILAASILVISMIDSKKLSESLGAITVLFADLMGSMAIFGKISGNLTGVFKANAAMISISIAVLILASALKKIGDLELDQLATGLVGIIGLTATMVAAAKILGSGGNTIIKGATQMIIFAAAIKILASVCRDLSVLNWDELARGLLGVGALLLGVSVFLRTAKFDGKVMSTATGIVILAGALKILASVCNDFAQMNTDQLTKGLVSVGVVLAEVAAFTRITGNAQHVISTGIALIAIGAAMKIFASAVKDMSTMTWGEIARGLVTMAGALLAVTLAVRSMPNNMIGIGVGLVAVSAALVILAEALGRMGNMDGGGIAKALIALGGSVLILAVGLNAMNGTLAGSAALLVAAASLAVLTPVLLALGSMSWGEIAKGLITIAGAFAVIGVAGLVLTPLVPTILSLAGAFALIGVGVLAIGAGLLVAGTGLSAIAIGISALATAFAGGATAIVAGITVIITGIANLIPLVVTKIGEAIIAFCKVIAEGAPAIAEAIKAIVLNLVDVLIECVPAIADCILEVISAVWASLAQYTPQIIDSLFDFLIALIDGIAARLPELIQSAMNLIMQFFSGVIDALSGIDVETLIKGLAGVGLMAGIMAALAAVAGLIPGAMVGVLGMGAVIAELALVLAAVGALAQIPGLEWLIGEGGDLLQSIGTAIGQFFGGIVGGFAEGATSTLPEIGTNLSQFMVNAMPFITGVKLITPESLEGVKTLVGIITELTKANIVDSLTSWLTGGSSLADFGNQLVPFGEAMVAFSNSISGVNVEAVTATANAGKILAEMAASIPNTGGVASWFAGDNRLDEFGAHLVSFGTAMVGFSETVAGKINEGAILAAANAGAIMIALADTLPNTGGVISWFAGDNTLDVFGTQIVAFGEAMVEFSQTISGNIDEAAIAAAASAGAMLAALANSLPSSGGFASIFTEDNDMSTFGSELKKFGESLKEFSDEVVDVDTGAISKVISQCNRLVALAKNMSGVDFTSFGDLSDALKSVGKKAVDKFVEAFEDADSKVTDAINDMISEVIDSIKGKYSDFSDAGSKCASKFAKGIEDDADKAKKKAKTMASDAADAADDKYDDFYDAGESLAKGFAAGIDDNTYRAEAQARAMAQAAADAAKEALRINSPSKVFRAIGTSVPEGFAQGIGKLGNLIESSSYGMADTAIDSFKHSIARLANVVNSNVDTQPTIRPVVDLSNVRSSAGAIKNMLNMDSSVGVLANAGSINVMMNRRNRNGANDDVVSAIKQLDKHLDNVGGGDSYSIGNVTYDSGSAIADAIQTIARAAVRERRV